MSNTAECVTEAFEEWYQTFLERESGTIAQYEMVKPYMRQAFEAAFDMGINEGYGSAIHDSLVKKSA